VRESNARFVRWSDGSLQLLLGEEVLDVSEHDVTSDNRFLFVRRPGFIQVRDCSASPKRPLAARQLVHLELASHLLLCPFDSFFSGTFNCWRYGARQEDCFLYIEQAAFLLQENARCWKGCEMVSKETA
jgi:Leo1-like protein